MKRTEIEKESYIVDEMIALFCKKNHHSKKGELCSDCQELTEYCHYRLSLCPFKENKTFCSNCKIHCYNKEHRERIRTVMRFSGPRMLFHHPILAIKHVVETKKGEEEVREK